MVKLLRAELDGREGRDFAFVEFKPGVELDEREVPTLPAVKLGPEELDHGGLTGAPSR
jgi:hypothetical protein